MVADLKPIFKVLILMLFLSALGWLEVSGSDDTKDVTSYGKPLLYIAQVLGVLFIFVLIPGLFVFLFTKDKLRYPRLHIAPGALLLLLAAGVFLLGLPLIAWMESINHQMTLPASLSGLENWMKVSEEKQGKIAEFMLSGTGVKNLVVNLFVIAFMAAFSEELFFRGILQKAFLELSKNVHVAVWVTAALFSAFHMQFYGFLPRMVMGALLGYLFVWSGSLWVNIFAHFVNNAFAVVVSWLAQRGSVSKDLENVDVGFPVMAGVISLMLVSGLMYLVYRNRRIEVEVPVAVIADPMDQM